jgi:hypothetical protein
MYTYPSGSLLKGAQATIEIASAPIQGIDALLPWLNLDQPANFAVCMRRPFTVTSYQQPLPAGHGHAVVLAQVQVLSPSSFGSLHTQ